MDTILLIEDERPIRKMLKINLEAEGYQVIETETAKEGIQLCARYLPTLVLLDLMLPDMPGKTVLKMLREFTQIPVIVLSAISSDESKIELLDAGADDYLTKPFSPGELLARVRVGLRHKPLRSESILSTNELVLDPAERSVVVRNTRRKLTPIEFALLALLMQHAGKTITRETLIQAVWGSHENETGSLRVHINQLRKKIEHDPANPCIIINEPGIGYRLTV